MSLQVSIAPNGNIQPCPYFEDCLNYPSGCSGQSYWCRRVPSEEEKDLKFLRCGSDNKGEKTKLSIIIPVYNVAPFLRRCLDSVKLTDNMYGEVEVIVVDDGSTDGSGEICDEYKDRFEIIHQKNGGCCRARNAGVDATLGDYITHLDSDDMYVDGAIETMLKIIDKYGDFDMVQFNHLRCNNDGQITRKFLCDHKPYSLKELPPYWVVVWNKIYKGSFIRDNNIRFRDGLNFDDDRMYNLECFNYTNRIQCVRDITVLKYFDNEGSICHTLNQDKLLNSSEAMISMLRKGDCPPMVQRIIRECMANAWTSKRYDKFFGGDL